MEYKTYIQRDAKEIEVYADLWTDAEARWVGNDDEGWELEIFEYPKFILSEAYTCGDDCIVPLDSFTDQEVYCIIDHLTEQYFDRYTDNV